MMPAVSESGVAVSKRLALPTILITITVCLFTGLASADNAQADCSGAGFFFDGFVARNTPVGVRGDVQDRQVFLCGADHSDGSAWIMLAGGGANDYAQIGYYRHNGQSQEHIFSEWSCSASNWALDAHPGFNGGDHHSYQVSYNFDSGHAVMLKGGDVVDQTGCDPAISWGSPWTGQFFGETHDKKDDIPGTPGNRADFSGLRTQTCRSCGYGDPDNVTNYQDADAYKFNWINHPTHMEIWTNR